MDKKTAKWMKIMVDAAQPSCDEKISAAMTCSHAGAMKSLLVSKLMGGAGVSTRTSDLPQPVFIAVGENTIYAFKYVPRGFKFKIKKEVARWPKDDISVESEFSRGIATFVMTTKAGDSYALEITTAMGAQELAEVFLAALQS